MDPSGTTFLHRLGFFFTFFLPKGHELSMLICHVRYPLVNQRFANLNMAIFMVDLSIKKGDFPWFFVSLPEGRATAPMPRCL